MASTSTRVKMLAGCIRPARPRAGSLAAASGRKADVRPTSHASKGTHAEVGLTAVHNKPFVGDRAMVSFQGTVHEELSLISVKSRKRILCDILAVLGCCHDDRSSYPGR